MSNTPFATASGITHISVESIKVPEGFLQRNEALCGRKLIIHSLYSTEHLTEMARGWGRLGETHQLNVCDKCFQRYTEATQKMMRSYSNIKQALAYYEQKLPSIERNESEATIESMRATIDALKWVLNMPSAM